MYRHVVAAGTFDGLHRGHRFFLTRAFASGGLVTIGLTSERYIRVYKKGKNIAPYSIRYKALTRWLRQAGFSSRATVIPLDDPYGPAILPDGFEAIVVTEDNRHTAVHINTERLARGLAPLVVIDVPLVAAEDHVPISSTRMRAGEIDTEGKLILPDHLRAGLQKPLGRVLQDGDIRFSVVSRRDQIIIAVGDVTTQKIFSFGVQPSLAIIDLHAERRPFQTFEQFKFPRKYRRINVISGPGYISESAVIAIKQWATAVRSRTVIVVSGEEDLLAIPAIIHAPAGSTLYYGQPKGALWDCGPDCDGGLVEVTVTAQKQQEARSLLDQFTRP